MQFRDPVLGFYEGRGLRDVVDYEGGLGIAVVHGSERCEAFLACGVPDFKFYGASWEVAFLGEEGGCLRVSSGSEATGHLRSTGTGMEREYGNG